MPEHFKHESPLLLSGERGESEFDEERKITRACYEATLAGRKPSSVLSLEWDVSEHDLEEARRRGLEVVPTGSAIGAATDQPKDAVVIGRSEKFITLLSAGDLERFRTLGLGERLDKLIQEIGDQSIAQAMRALNEYPRVDEEYDITEFNLERPEVAALSGIGLGYPACDIEYYVRVRYLGEARNPHEQEDPVYGHALCREHSQAELRKRSQNLAREA